MAIVTLCVRYKSDATRHRHIIADAQQRQLHTASGAGASAGACVVLSGMQRLQCTTGPAPLPQALT